MSVGQLAFVAALVACSLLTQKSVVAQDDGVREPPLISKPAKQMNVYILKGISKSLECKATGIPKPTYIWKKDDIAVVSNTDITVSSTEGTLIFNSFKEAYEGNYTCFATNVYSSEGERTRSTSMSPPVQVLLQFVDPFKNIPERSFAELQYDYFRIECNGQGLIQLPTSSYYNWYNELEVNQVKTDNGRIYIDSQGTLHFTYLLMTDAKTYKCGIANPDSAIVLGKDNKLTVTAKQASAMIPRFQYSNSGVKVELYKDAKLECFFSGYDPKTTNKLPTLKWFDDASNEITSTTDPKKYSISEDGRNLIIKNIQEQDEKNYYCQGVTSEETSQKERVFLDIISPPIFKDNGAPRDMTVPENKDAVFHCNAHSLNNEQAPSPPVWYINGAQSGNHNDPNKYVWSKDRKTLTILKLSKALDIQCITCSVENNYGITWRYGCLNVILGITVTNNPIERQEIKKGDLVNLTVIATTDPAETLSYSWKFKNDTYDLKPPHVIYDQTTKIAFINTSLLTQEEYDTIGGLYERILSHIYDTKIVPMEVILKDGPVVGPVVAKGGFDMWIIGLIIGILFLIVVIIIIIFVVCRKKQEGDYNVDKKETGAGLDPEKELKEKGFDDYSRPTYDDYEYPEKKPRGELEYDDVPIGGDDESLAEYGDETDLHFNEDGSFIGVYQNNKGPKGQPKSTESTI